MKKEFHNFSRRIELSTQCCHSRKSFDCGLFLVHYEKLFLEQAPVNFSLSLMSASPNLSPFLRFLMFQKIIYEKISTIEARKWRGQYFREVHYFQSTIILDVG